MFRFITFSLTVVILCFVFTYAHEEAHRQVLYHYNIDSHIEWFSHFPVVVTVPDSPCPTESCILANNIVDSYGYQMQIVFLLLGVIAITLFSFLVQIVWILEDIHKELINYRVTKEQKGL